jgi:DNA-binding response OmpR family regulator
MQPISVSPNVIRFALFEVDLSAGELRKRGRKVPLQDQPFRVLTLLLQRPGELVSREEFKRGLWPDDTFVDFDEGLNKAIQKLRQALGDSHPPQLNGGEGRFRYGHCLESCRSRWLPRPAFTFGFFVRPLYPG